MDAFSVTQKNFTRRSLQDPEGFWAGQAQEIHWEAPFQSVCDFSNPPFAKWFVGGRTNLCYNAVDRHLAMRGEEVAIHFISTETGERRTFTYYELHRQVVRMAAVLLNLGLAKGDRIVLYLPMIPEAAFAMLACARLGLIHSVVFAGFAAENLARRVSDADARLIITCDASLRNSKLVPLKRTVDAALQLCKDDVRVLLIDRGLDPEAPRGTGRDLDYASLAEQVDAAEVPCVWLESNEPSYILYTSGTTARPKGVQRDVGGYAVALAASMRHIFDCRMGETYFCTADIGWVVGHSYTIYGPLIHGMATVIFEGLPIHEEASAWWRIAEETKAVVMFSSPTAMRVLKKHASSVIRSRDLGRLRHLFLAGEPLDEPTSVWIREALGHVNIVDNYWQTETGWPILSRTMGLPPAPASSGSPGDAVYGYDALIVDELTGAPLEPGEKGVLAIRTPLPPGCMSTIWGNDTLFANHYFGRFPGTNLYSTFDYAVRDEDGCFFILGRTDDVINVAGHRIGTREIEEALCSHRAVAEAVAVGAADEVKWQVVKCFVVLKDSECYASEEQRKTLLTEIENTVIHKMGAIARPAFVGIVGQLPKTRSGKTVRRAILAIVDGRDPGDLSTLEDPGALDHIRQAHDRADVS